MKNLLSILVLFLYSMGGYAQEIWSDQSRILPDILRNHPISLILYHDPNPVYPAINTDTLHFQGKYIWKHSTTVLSPKQDLIIISAGSFIWFKGKGWVKNMNLSPDDFSSLFGGKNGVLKKGHLYTYQKNYRLGDKIFPGDALWYVLAKDKKGEIYEGMALIETEGELRPISN